MKDLCIDYDGGLVNIRVGAEELLVWVSPEEGRKLYPAFFNTELRCPRPGVEHYVTEQARQMKSHGRVAKCETDAKTLVVS